MLPTSSFNHLRISADSQPKPEARAPTSNWSGPRGYGGRHILDKAPFSLWDEVKNEFRSLSSSEIGWLAAQYKPSCIEFQFPVMVIETADPPNPLPLTVACIAVNFVSPPLTPVPRSSWGMPLELLYDARPIGITTNYAGMRNPPDPLQFKFRKWIQPTDEELELLVDALFQFCNPRRVSILCFHIIIELRIDDDRTYETGSLPLRVGGFATHYHHHFPESVFEGLTKKKMEELTSPVQRMEDFSSPTASTQNNLTSSESRRPRRLLPSQEIPNGAFFTVDGISTGAVYLQSHGIALDIAPRPESCADIQFTKWIIYRVFGALAAIPRDEICGAAIIEAHSEEGGVAGFIQDSNAYYALSPCLDDLIDRSQDVV